MYAPHASLAPLRPAALDFVDLTTAVGLTMADDLTVGPIVPTLGVVSAVAALLVAVQLLRVRPLWPRSGAWFAVATALAGLTALVPLAGALLGATTTDLVPLLSVGAIAAGSAFLPALILLPSSAGRAERLRWAIDTAIVWLCLMFCGWTLTEQRFGVDVPAFGVIAFQSLVVAAAVVAGVGPGAGHRGAALCVTGVATTTVVLGSLAYEFDQHPSLGWQIVDGMLLVAAPLMIWRGGLGLGAADPPASPRSIPIHAATATTVAAALALFAALDQVLARDPIGWAESLIAGVAAVAVGVRMWLGAISTEVAGSAERLPLLAPAPEQERPCRGLSTQLLARTDPLTGLATRQQLSLAIAGLRCVSRDSGALLAIGIDGLGAATGVARDQVQREVARRLRLASAPEEGRPEIPARLSEIRFAVLTGASALRAYGLASRLLTVLGEPVAVPGQTVRLSACVGLAQLAHARSTEDTLQRAELALRRARQLGTGRVEWYDAAVEEAMQRNDTIERDLPTALRRGELDLIYQPIMDLVRGRPLAVEALLRWRHPRLGTLLPGDVIPVAEEIGLIGELGRWVLRQATGQLHAWRREGRDISMSVNISPRDLDTPAITADLARVLADHDVPPDRLVFEVAEPAIEDGDRLAEHLGALRSLGVRTALDEFGAGPESLTHLRQVPIDMVKIGPSIFAGTAVPGVPAPLTGGGAAPMPLVEVIVGVGRRLGFDVVAQGLEAPEQLALVRTAGCQLGQGHLFARPQPAEHTEAYLAGFPTRL